MHDYASPFAAGLVSDERAGARDLEERLAESGTLAFRVAFGVLRNREDAEDVAQDAFLRTHQRFPSLRDRDRFRAWLVRLTWRLALDRRRSERRRLAREESVAPAIVSEDGESEAIARDRAGRLWAAIDRLPDELRLPLVLASIEGHTVSNVAALSGIPEGTVKSRLFEARRRLKEWLS
jgi:RNA polymerase sigma-70 factor (ECF subfamily)